MKIALVGYGKMGKAIEEIALNKGHEVVLRITIDNTEDLTYDNLRQADVAIEFTGPESAFKNLKMCLSSGIPVVSGSTGWLEHWDELVKICEDNNGALIYASNYSIGVNLFFELNLYLAELMNKYDEYDVKMEEIHHTQKLDAPSGTAISLAQQILQRIERKKNWINSATQKADEIEIISKRIDPAPGTHSIKYTSGIDDIEIIHTAHNRKGFAGGALKAAEFIVGKTGIFTMKDVLGL